MELFGIRLVGVNTDNGHKLLLTILFITAILTLKWLVAKMLDLIYSRVENRRIRFWGRQGINLFASFVIFLTILSIWFDDPTRLTTGLGLVTAGLAFALQKVVTSFAGYIIIMRGNTFGVGERITMGGIRGDVISLGYIQTTIMEMGQPPSVQNANPEMWIRGRQFTGRIVTVTNDKIFENPVYNYTRDFSFLWEEMSFPIKYTQQRKKVEEILMQSVKKHTEKYLQMSSDQREMLERKYAIQLDDMIPRVFYRLTDNWLEMSVRFIVPEHGIRNVKDAISREVLDHFDRESIELASATIEVVGLPQLKFKPLGKDEKFPEQGDLRRNQ